ncbi:MAG: hypothetical protein ED559_03225 [Phycisphaera sp.]|nr:MAG: hypothetical protein ED559_03225 [Phycisphaera sp.]
MADGEGSGGGSGNTIKIIIAVVLLGVAGYFAYANFLGGGGDEPPKSAVEDLSEEKQQELENEAEKQEIPEEEIGGA